jgi:cobaltochelatase CobN
LQQGVSAQQAGQQSAYRIFGDIPGTYGTGVNRVVERSGSWENRSEVAAVYMQRMGHAYGLMAQGDPQHALFKQRLNTVGNTYLGRSSNLYGLLDNNDSFDYLGGLSLAVETVRGSVPNNYILSHESNTELSVEPLSVALLTELRGRFLNPQWLQPLMKEGYAGARTMGSEFFEYLWGWQVTNPEVVKSWVWNDVKSVYIDDRHNIGLDKFLDQDHNVHVKSNMLAVMITAAQKGFWDADQATLKQLSQEFAQLILENGLPGSGHTSPSSPIFDYIKEYVDEAQYRGIAMLLEAAKVDTNHPPLPSTISELNSAPETRKDEDQHKAAPKTTDSIIDYDWLIYLLVLLAIIGMIRGAHAPKSKPNS